MFVSTIACTVHVGGKCYCCTLTLYLRYHCCLYPVMGYLDNDDSNLCGSGHIAIAVATHPANLHEDKCNAAKRSIA